MVVSFCELNSGKTFGKRFPLQALYPTLKINARPFFTWNGSNHRYSSDSLKISHFTARNKILSSDSAKTSCFTARNKILSSDSVKTSYFTAHGKILSSDSVKISHFTARNKILSSDSAKTSCFTARNKDLSSDSAKTSCFTARNKILSSDSEYSALFTAKQSSNPVLYKRQQPAGTRRHRSFTRPANGKAMHPCPPTRSNHGTKTAQAQSSLLRKVSEEV